MMVHAPGLQKGLSGVVNKVRGCSIEATGSQFTGDKGRERGAEVLIQEG